MLIGERRVSLVECAALAVLAHEADVVAVLGETAEGHRLCSGPVNLTRIQALHSIGDVHLGQSGMHRKSFRDGHRLSADFLECINVVARVTGLCALLRWHHACPLVRVRARALVLWIHGVLQLGFVRETFLVFGLEVTSHILPELADVTFADDSLILQTLSEGMWKIQMVEIVAHFSVHLGLGERRLVNLVVAVLSEADHVNQDVLVERFPVLDHEAANADQSLGRAGCISSIDAHNRHLEALDYVTRIREAPAIAAGSCKADLIVGHDVDRTTNGKLGQVLQGQRLVGCSLTCERGISVALDVEHALAI